MSDFIAYPAWWKSGTKVVGRDGTVGTLAQSPSGSWTVEFEPTYTGQGIAVSRYMPDPNPRDWAQTASLTLTESQARQVAYEADRAFLTAIGRGIKGSEWQSLPDSKRMAPTTLFPVPLEGDGYRDVRKAIYTAIDKALGKYVR